MRASRNSISKYILFAAMISFASALLRAPVASKTFEFIKFPMLIVAVLYLLYSRPVIRLNLGSLFMWLYVVLVFFSTVYNSGNSPALFSSVGVFIVIGIYFQVISNSRDPEDHLNQLLLWVSLAVVFTSLIFLPFPASYIGGRFAAGFINTNVASGLLAIAVVVLSYKVIFEKPRLIFVLTMSAAVFLLLLTKGRGSLIAAALPISIMLISNWRDNSTRINLLRLSGLVFALVFYLKFDISETTEASDLSLMSYRSFELGARETIIRGHLDSFWHSPIIGVGAVIDENSPYSRTSGESSYTDLLALSGAMGIILIAVLVGRSLWTLWHNCSSRLGFFALVTVLLLSSSEGYFVSIASVVSLFLWALLAVTPGKGSAE